MTTKYFLLDTLFDKPLAPNAVEVDLFRHRDGNLGMTGKNQTDYMEPISIENRYVQRESSESIHCLAKLRDITLILIG